MQGWKLGMSAVVLCIVPSFHLSAQNYRAKAVAVLKTVPLIDGHNDIPDAIRERGGLDSVDFAAEGRFVIRDPWSLQIRAGTGRQRLSSSRNQRHSAASALLGIKF